jgi:hypothetical protein
MFSTKPGIGQEPRQIHPHKAFPVYRVMFSTKSGIGQEPRQIHPHKAFPLYRVMFSTKPGIDRNLDRSSSRSISLIQSDL